MKNIQAGLAAIGLLAMMAMSAPAARAEVTHKSENGFAIKHQVRVTADTKTAWDMLRSPAKWWSGEHSWTGDANNFYLDAQAGGCFCEKITDKKEQAGGPAQITLRGSVEHMRVVFADPGKLLRMRGGLGPLQGEGTTGTLTIILQPIRGGGTQISFEYVVGGFARFSLSELAPVADKVVGEQASRLAMALGPMVGSPLPNAPDDEQAADKGKAAEPGSDAAKSGDAKPDQAKDTKGVGKTVPGAGNDLPDNYVPSIPTPRSAPSDGSRIKEEDLPASDAASPAPDADAAEPAEEKPDNLGDIVSAIGKESGSAKTTDEPGASDEGEQSADEEAAPKTRPKVEGFPR